jgi:hypothetical protein
MLAFSFNPLNKAFPETVSLELTLQILTGKKMS